jgi:putative ABC transport system permease protein
VLALVLKDAFVLDALGLLLGVPLTVSADCFLRSQLYGLSQHDPVVISAAVVALGVSALVAALIPAFRATLISPLNALRSE